MDLRAVEQVTLEPGVAQLVPTGLTIELPAGWEAQVRPRSGLALRHGVTVLNSPGLIDCGYRDELKVLLVNLDPTEPFEVHRGDRIAQLVVQAVAEVAWMPVDELPPSERGGGGFGHTGR
jgi:dUTP pyrophosphatase